MSDPDIAGELPAIDADLATWLASDPAPVMPAEVWTELQARLAAEPPLVAPGVIDLGAERARRRRGRLLPVLAGAAGIAVVGAVVLPTLRSPEPAPVADGVTASTSLVAEPAPDAAESQPVAGQSGPVASTPEGAVAVIPESAVPRAMVSTGTDYTDEALPSQVVTLLANVGMADAPGVATAMNAAPAETTMPGSGLASSPQALADCLERLGMPAGSVPLLLDTATVEGAAGSVIVTAGELAPEGAPTSLHVVAVGQECTDDDVAAARHWDIPVD